MNARTLFERRFSCRNFDTTALDRTTVEAVLEAARWAPNGGNLQPWRFVVVLDSSRRRTIAGAAYGQGFLAQAPVVITVCAVPDESATKYGPRGRELHCLQDTAAAAENTLLAATDLGLGSCWVGAFDEAAIVRALELPRSWRPVALIALGHPAFVLLDLGQEVVDLRLDLGVLGPLAQLFDVAFDTIHGGESGSRVVGCVETTHPG
jgi:nitroreductase